MREIKFRAWDNDRKIMHYFEESYGDMEGEWFITFKGEILEWHSGTGGPFLVENVTLMQSTGLKDRDIREVFEGDIVRFTKWNRTSGGNMELTGVVKWNNQGGGMWITNSKYYTILQELVLSGGENGFCMDNLVVIGNIYETPSLVNEG